MPTVSLSNLHAERVGWHLKSGGHSWNVLKEDEGQSGNTTVETDANKAQVETAMEESVAVVGDRCSAIDWLPDLPPGCSGIAGGYVVRPRPCASGPSTKTFSVYSDAVESELTALAAERARGETLAVDGDVWGGAHVVITHPRPFSRGFHVIDLNLLGGRYPALLAACEIRTPNNDEAPPTKVHLKITQLDTAVAAGRARYRIRALNPKTAALESELASAVTLPTDGATDACYRLARERGFDPVSHSLDVLLQ